MIASTFRNVQCLAAAADGSQGQVRSTPPLDQTQDVSARPEGAAEPQPHLSLATFFHAFGVFLLSSLAIIGFAITINAQGRTYPKEIRGYKVERAVVELKSTPAAKPPSKSDKEPKTNQDLGAGSSSGSSPATQTTVATSSANSAVDQLIKFGSPSLARITPLGITFDVPVVVAPIKQSGKVDFLLFEDMMVNDHSIEIDEYHRAFDLPTRKPLTLREPLRFFIYTPVAALAAVNEWGESKETWPVTGRVYVCGKYKKFFLSFKRCVPVELNLTMRNPLRSK